MEIDAIDVIPICPAQHIRLKADINGVEKQSREYTRAELLVPLTAEEIEQTIVNCIRIHVKDSGLTNFAQIRANLQAWELTL